MSTRDLRVRFVGDASGLKSSFAEANAASSGFSTGVGKAGDSSEKAGKSIGRTGKLFKASGKFIRSSGLDAAAAGAGFLSTIPALGGMSSALGIVVTQSDALSGVLSGHPAALALVAAGAVAAGAAYLIMKKDVESATAALRHQEDANRDVAKAHYRTADAVRAHQDSSAAVEGALLAEEQAALAVLEANKNLAKAEKDNGKNSLEYRNALLQQKSAQDGLRTSRRESIRQAQELITQTRETSKQIKVEARETREAADAARLKQKYVGNLITGKDAVRVSKEIQKAFKAEAQASTNAASKHREQAARLSDLAGRMDTGTARGRALKAQLEQLARQNLDMSGAIAAMDRLAGAAGRAAAAVRNVAAAIAGVGSFPGTGGSGRARGGGGNPNQGKKQGEKPGTQQAGSIEMGRRRGLIPRRGELNPLSFTDIVGGIIGRRHRDDSLQDKVAGSKARSKARGSGIENPDKLDAISEKAVAELRKKELQADIRTTQNQRKKLRGRIGDLRKRLASQRASRRKAKKDDQPKWDSAIQDTLGRIRGLWDEDRAMARDINEMRAEAKELGYDIGRLDDTIGGLPNAVPDEAEEAAKALGPASPEDFLDAAAAEAALTPDVGDDIAVAEQAVAHFGRGLDAARAGGDPRAIAAAAQALLAARNNLDQLKATRDNTDALNANTAAVQGFGGSSTFSYRGQDYTLRSLAPPSSDRLVEATI
jgi:hypothetical protein